MSRTLLWNVKEQKVEGVFPNNDDADDARDQLLARNAGVDPVQSGRVSLVKKDFQNVKVKE
jgi:hypothetical protein